VKEKPRAPTPPSVIVDQGRGRSYTRIGFLGEVSLVYQILLSWSPGVAD